jgi:hypothetical protein
VLLYGCVTTADNQSKQLAATFTSVSHEANACRSHVAADPRYRQLAVHMPLVQPFDTTLVQLTDPRFASHDDIVALGYWLDDMQSCRAHLSDAVLRAFPVALSVLVAGWNRDDETFADLADHKLAWGPAVRRLRNNRAETLKELTDQMLTMAKQLNSNEQAELSRRVAVLNAITNLAP